MNDIQQTIKELEGLERQIEKYDKVKDASESGRLQRKRTKVKINKLPNKLISV